MVKTKQLNVASFGETEEHKYSPISFLMHITPVHKHVNNDTETYKKDPFPLLSHAITLDLIEQVTGKIFAYVTFIH